MAFSCGWACCLFLIVLSRKINFSVCVPIYGHTPSVQTPAGSTSYRKPDRPGEEEHSPRASGVIARMEPAALAMSVAIVPPPPLLSLPFELRQSVYSFLLSFEEPLPDLINGEIVHDCRGLIESCHLFHEEASAYYFSKNIFRVSFANFRRKEDGTPAISPFALGRVRRLRLELQIWTDGFEDYIIWQMNTMRYIKIQKERIQSFIRHLEQSKSGQDDILLDSLILSTNVEEILDSFSCGTYLLEDETSIYVELFDQVKERVNSFQAQTWRPPQD